MVTRKNIIGIIAVIIVTLLFIPLDKKGKKTNTENFKSLKINGEISLIRNNIKGEKGFFILVDTCWFHVINYSLENYAQIGDTIVKDKMDDFLLVINNKEKTFDNILFFKSVTRKELKYKLEK